MHGVAGNSSSVWIVPDGSDHAEGAEVRALRSRPLRGDRSVAAAILCVHGLRTNVGLVKGPEMWMYCGSIILVATIGKLGGSMPASWWTGMPAREAAGLGTLMNTRGLMELVILNIGLDIKVISPTLFSMMVLMALTTTFMTSPVLQAICPDRILQKPAAAEAEEFEAGQLIFNQAGD